MLKSIPTKDSPFPQLPKCFEMEFGPQKSRVLFLWSRGGLWKNSVWYGGDLKKFCPFKKYPLPPPPQPLSVYIMNAALAELKIATNMVANATNILSLATKNSSLRSRRQKG